VDALCLLGVACCQLKRFAEAVDPLRKAVKLAPKHAPAHNLLGSAFKEIGRTDEALASFNRAISHQPDLMEAYVHRADLLMALNRWAEAVETYDRACRSSELFSRLVQPRRRAREDGPPRRSHRQLRPRACVAGEPHRGARQSGQCIGRLGTSSGRIAWQNAGASHLDKLLSSPWYPATRLFRQSRAGDWPGVFARITDAVRALAPQAS
jgi:tetratricopeptide (TPR) repeat protein